MRPKFDLVCFDMDGTLTRLRSSWAWIHQCLGVSNEEAYRAFVNGEIDEPEFMRRDIAKWKSAKPDFCKRDMIRCFQSMPVIDGIQETVASLQENGMRCVIVSGGIDIAAEMLANEYGFDGWMADSVLWNPDGTLEGNGKVVVDLRDKGVYVKQFIDRFGTDSAHTLSIGNSFTDIGMFKVSAESIAFNPTDEYTVEAATHTVRSDTISDILDVILPDDSDDPDAGMIAGMTAEGKSHPTFGSFMKKKE